MILRSWTRFVVRGLAVVPGVMGSAASFPWGAGTAIVTIPRLDEVGTVHEANPRATRGAWNGDTDETFHFHIHSVDTEIALEQEIPLPVEILSRRPKAKDLVDQPTHDRLDRLAEESGELAGGAFEYFTSILRWVTGSHGIGRHERIGNESGWATYLRDAASRVDVWASTHKFVISGVREVKEEHWSRACDLASRSITVPVHVSLLSDAYDCVRHSDYRRAMIDISVACEVFLRRSVIESLPHGTPPEVARFIEDGNINQFVAHLFPALLDTAALTFYRTKLSGELSSLFAKRNKLMHTADESSATRENCRRFAKVAEDLFTVLTKP